MVLKAIEGPRSTASDWLKWLIVVLFLAAGIVANYYYSTQPWPLRLLGWLVLLSICLLYTSPSPRDGLLSRMPSSA